MYLFLFANDPILRLINFHDFYNNYIFNRQIAKFQIQKFLLLRYFLSALSIAYLFHFANAQFLRLINLRDFYNNYTFDKEISHSEIYSAQIFLFMICLPLSFCKRSIPSSNFKPSNYFNYFYNAKLFKLFKHFFNRKIVKFRIQKFTQLWYFLYISYVTYVTYTFFVSWNTNFSIIFLPFSNFPVFPNFLDIHNPELRNSKIHTSNRAYTWTLLSYTGRRKVADVIITNLLVTGVVFVKYEVLWQLATRRCGIDYIWILNIHFVDADTRIAWVVGVKETTARINKISVVVSTSRRHRLEIMLCKWRPPR